MLKLAVAFLVISVLLFILSACASEVDRDGTATPVPTATLIPTPTNTPVPTPTLTPTATLPAPTPVPVILPGIDNNIPPHVFVGSLTIGGLAAPDGTEVTVWVPQYNRPIGTGVTLSGNYSVLAHQHGFESFQGNTLIFKVSGKDTGETGTWDKGGGSILALSVE